ncbi:MAG: YeeE/YedE family protein [Hyphomicrobiales bacterium]|nr:YeeE/YedE family protein [Hyphomicrobiales bacterium]
MEEMSTIHLVAWAGFAAGLVFGAVANWSNFCTMGSLSDIVFMGDYNRFRAWMLAIAVALAGTQALAAAEVIDLSRSIYLTPNLGWLGAILGGLMFGFGMTMAGGCANKNLVRIGGGNLKSVVVILVMGLFAYMTLRGLIGLARVEMEALANLDLAAAAEVESQGLPDLAALATGLEADMLRWVLVAAIAGGLAVFCFASASFRRSPRDILAGLLVGALVPAGWWITGVLGFDDFEPVALGSFTFVAPAGESLQYLMTFSGTTINFGVATVGGVIVGSFLTALVTRGFHVEAFADKGDMVRHLFGAAIMGVGGVLALGCTVGQGITGMSTLAAGSAIALLSILAGGLVGLKYLEEGSLGGAIGALFARG